MIGVRDVQRKPASSLAVRGAEAGSPQLSRGPLAVHDGLPRDQSSHTHALDVIFRKFASREE
jgi:hypothetical protein